MANHPINTESWSHIILDTALQWLHLGIFTGLKAGAPAAYVTLMCLLTACCLPHLLGCGHHSCLCVHVFTQAHGPMVTSMLHLWPSILKLGFWWFKIHRQWILHTHQEYLSHGARSEHNGQQWRLCTGTQGEETIVIGQKIVVRSGAAPMIEDQWSMSSRR